MPPQRHPRNRPAPALPRHHNPRATLSPAGPLPQGNSPYVSRISPSPRVRKQASWFCFGDYGRAGAIIGGVAIAVALIFFLLEWFKHQSQDPYTKALYTEERYQSDLRTREYCLKLKESKYQQQWSNLDCDKVLQAPFLPRPGDFDSPGPIVNPGPQATIFLVLSSIYHLLWDSTFSTIFWITVVIIADYIYQRVNSRRSDRDIPQVAHASQKRSTIILKPKDTLQDTPTTPELFPTMFEPYSTSYRQVSTSYRQNSSSYGQSSSSYGQNSTSILFGLGSEHMNSTRGLFRSTPVKVVCFTSICVQERSSHYAKLNYADGWPMHEMSRTRRGDLGFSWRILPQVWTSK
ncbi:hypothetical protein V8F33_013755 [Rhypophila sp. PSN 637]